MRFHKASLVGSKCVQSDYRSSNGIGRIKGESTNKDGVGSSRFAFEDQWMVTLTSRLHEFKLPCLTSNAIDRCRNELDAGALFDLAPVTFLDMAQSPVLFYHIA